MAGVSVREMELGADTAVRYARHAFTQMLAVADRLGDDLVNERPHGPSTNAVAAIVMHCCGVAEFWLGHVGVGRPSGRDRDAEFSAVATVAELHEAVSEALARLEDDVRTVVAGADSAYSAGRELLLDGDGTSASLVIHVLEELFQHLGQAELTADALLQA